MNLIKLAKNLTNNGLTLIGKALPLGGSVVTDLIKDTLGLESDNDIEKALKDPASILKLKELEQNKEIEFLRLINQDLSNARAKATDDNHNSDKFIRRFDEYYAIMIGLMCIGILIGLFTIDIPERNHDLIKILTGSMFGSFGTIVAFYFGNTKKGKQ